MSRAIQFSIQSKKGKYPRRPGSAAWSKLKGYEMQNKQRLAATLTGISAIGVFVRGK
jgi:hypothetical protein